MISYFIVSEGFYFERKSDERAAEILNLSKMR